MGNTVFGEGDERGAYCFTDARNVGLEEGENLAEERGDGVEAGVWVQGGVGVVACCYDG